MNKPVKKHKGAPSGAPALPDADARTAYMALEPKLRDVRRMAKIACLMAMHDFEEPGEESLGLTAIEQLDRMIDDLNQSYNAFFEGAVGGQR